jgi:hypothetical protein
MGPLELWQWAAIGAALGIMYYIYKLRQNAAGTAQTPPAAAGTTSAGPIDPTTGIPYAQEGGGVSGGTGTQPTLQSELGDLQTIQSLLGGTAPQSTLEGELGDLASIESLMTGLTLPNGGATPGPGHVSLPKSYTKQLQALTHEVQKLQRQQRKDGRGHKVTRHPGGRHTANSSAHNAGQRGPKPVSPPNHQRANQQHHSSSAMARAERQAAQASGREARARARRRRRRRY